MAKWALGIAGTLIAAGLVWLAGTGVQYVRDTRAMAKDNHEDVRATVDAVLRWHRPDRDPADDLPASWWAIPAANTPADCCSREDNLRGAITDALALLEAPDETDLYQARRLLRRALRFGQPKEK